MAGGVVSVRADQARAAAGGPPLARWPGWPLLPGPAVTLAVMLWGIRARPYWGDEADTVSALQRSLPQLLRMTVHVDAVHGFYYLLLWPVARVAGTGELATRLPSAVAMAAAAFGVAALGGRLRSRRTGLWAGLAFAVLPMIALQGHDARPYAMVTAAAVLASWQLIRVADNPRAGRLALYALSLVLLGYLELLALLLIAAHAVTLAGWHGGDCGWRGLPGRLRRSRLARRWLVTAAVAGAAVSPVAVLGWLQRVQIAWIPSPTWASVADAVQSLALGSAVSAAPAALLALLGVIAADAPGSAGRAGTSWRVRALGAGTRPGRGARAFGWLALPWLALPWLVLPWLVLPPLALLAASELRPIYNSRYIVFCLPAVALLAGAGLAALGWAVRAAVLALIVLLALPAQLALRAPRPDLAAAARVLAARQQPGDAVIFPGHSIPPWYLVYPWAFGRLREIGMARSGAAAGRLYAPSVPPPVVRARERGIGRIWVVEVGSWQVPAGYLAPGFQLVHVLRPGHGATWLGLYQHQRGPGADAQGRPARACPSPR
jgi:mannosyltransferase